MDSDVLSEYKSGTYLSSSLNEINSRLRSLEDSISTSLADYHQHFRPVASKIDQNASDLRILQNAINELSSEYHTKVSQRFISFHQNVTITVFVLFCIFLLYDLNSLLVPVFYR